MLLKLNALIPVQGLLLLFVLFACSKNTNPDQDLKEIQSLLDSQSSAWNRGDLEGFMKGYDRSDSLQFITRRGRTSGWQNVLNRYRKSYPTQKEMGNLTFNHLIFTPLEEDLMQVYGNWHVKKDSTDSGNFSLILKQKPEGWRIIIDHTW